jgi:hypothetical protein
MKNEFLNSTDISRILGVTPPTIINLINEGRIKSSKVIERTRRVDPEDLISYLENLGNDRRSMAGFKKDIYSFLYSKYNNMEYLKESNKQANLYEKYSEERFEALKK